MSSAMWRGRTEESTEGGPPQSWVAEKLNFVNAKWKRIYEGKVEKSIEQERMDKISEVIRTYRGVEEEAEAEGNTYKWVDSVQFDVFMSLVIVLNTLVIGLEADAEEDVEHRKSVWIILECCFVVIFLVEVGTKIWYHRWWWVVSSPMNFLTTVIAILALIDLVIIYPLRSSGDIQVEAGLRMISLLRIFGLVRLVRLIRHYNWLSELRVILQGLSQSLQAIVWIFLLTVLFLYVNALITTELIGHNDIYLDYKRVSNGWDYEEYFGTVPRSMFTLLQVLTLDNWSSKIARHVLQNQGYMAIFFIIFLLLGVYGLLNVIIAVIVERTLAIAQTNSNRVKILDNRSKALETQAFKDLWALVDTGAIGVTGEPELTKEDFEDALARNDDLKRRLHYLGFSAADVLRLFDSLDGEPRALDGKEFIAGMSRIKGTASSRDLLWIQAQADTLAQKIENLASEIHKGERAMIHLEEVSARIQRRFSYAVHNSRLKLAHSKGGAEPVLQMKRARPGLQENIDLAVGNRPALPHFPNLLN